MSNHFIPVSEEARIKLEEDFAKTPFRTPREFVEFFNMGLASKNSDVVKDYIEKLKDTYKDIDFKSGNIIFLDDKEVLLGEILDALEPYVLATRIRREVLNAIDAGELSRGDFIFLGETEGGYLGKLVQSEGEEPSRVRVGAEKLITKPEAVVPLFEKFSSVRQHSGETYVFRATDFADMDLEFIYRMNEALPV